MSSGKIKHARRTNLFKRTYLFVVMTWYLHVWYAAADILPLIQGEKQWALNSYVLPDKHPVVIWGNNLLKTLRGKDVLDPLAWPSFIKDCPDPTMRASCSLDDFR
jgi:hypothetical protein